MLQEQPTITSRLSFSMTLFPFFTFLLLFAVLLAACGASAIDKANTQVAIQTAAVSTVFAQMTATSLADVLSPAEYKETALKALDDYLFPLKDMYPLIFQATLDNNVIYDDTWKSSVRNQLNIWEPEVEKLGHLPTPPTQYEKADFYFKKTSEASRRMISNFKLAMEGDYSAILLVENDIKDMGSYLDLAQQELK